MEKSGHETSIPGCRQSDLKKSFKSAVRSLLSTRSKQDFLDIFSKFSPVEQGHLHWLYIQVIVNLHRTIEADFDAHCLETQVGSVLDTVEQLVEEQSLDPLFTDKMDVMDVANELRKAKKVEIQVLTDLLKTAEEQNRQMEARISRLENQTQDFSDQDKAVEKLKTGIMGYFESNGKQFPI